MALVERGRRLGTSMTVLFLALGLAGVPVRYTAPLGAAATAPPPPPPLTAAGFYGAGINADSKANRRIGATAHARLSHRFRASTTSSLQTVRFSQRGGDGYSLGNGGTMRITVQTDQNGVPSGTALAALTMSPGNPGGDWTTYREYSFSSPATLTRGTLYHIVFENTDPNQATNYVSVNDIFVATNYSPRQPALSDDYAVLYAEPTNWSLQTRYTAVMDLGYGDGTHDGMGYIGIIVGSVGVIDGPTHMLRERFTVSGGDRTVRAASVRVKRDHGSSPLIVRLEDADGTEIESVTIPAASVPTGRTGEVRGEAWVTATFSRSRVLANGRTYNLRLSTAADTEYSMMPVREGSDTGATEGGQQSTGFRSYRFTDGHGQRTTNGSSWSNLYEWSPVDLQFYFR